MITYADAVAAVLAHANAGGLATEEVALADALGRVLAQSETSARAVPALANSAMDGYAVRAADTEGASADRACTLRLSGELRAGDALGAPLASGAALAIMTGAPLPPGADAVVRREDSAPGDHHDGAPTVRVFHAPAKGEFVRPAGDDFGVGASLARAGDVLDARRLTVLATAGIGRVQVRRRPRIVVIPTGRELAEPGEPLPAESSVFNASATYLRAALAGCEVSCTPIVADDPVEFRARLEAASGADVIITTGAVSAGVADFIPQALRDAGARQCFHKVAIRPGKPILFAELGGSALFALPGNPISSIVGCRFFVWPWLLARLGAAAEHPLPAVCSGEVRAPRELRTFFKAEVRLATSGLVAHVLPAQGSHQVHALGQCNAWAIVPEAVERLQAGDRIEVLPFLGQWQWPAADGA